MALSKERMGEIALAAVKYKMAKDGTRIYPKDVKRQVGNFSKATGISVDEAMEFTRELLDEFIEKTFPRK